MKRVLFALGIGAAVVFARRRLMGAQQDTQPSWKGTDNDPEDSMRAGAPDDATIVDRVQSQVFRAVDVPVGAVNVNAEYGKVILRGELGSEDLIRDLVDGVRQVEGVVDVESQLSTPAGGSS